MAKMNFLAIFFAVPKNIAHFSLLSFFIRNFAGKYRNYASVEVPV